MEIKNPVFVLNVCLDWIETKPGFVGNVETKAYSGIKIFYLLPDAFSAWIQRKIWSVIMNCEAEIIFLYFLLNIWKELNIRYTDNKVYA